MVKKREEKKSVKSQSESYEKDNRLLIENLRGIHSNYLRDKNQKQKVFLRNNTETRPFLHKGPIS